MLVEKLQRRIADLDWQVKRSLGNDDYSIRDADDRDLLEDAVRVLQYQRRIIDGYRDWSRYSE